MQENQIICGDCLEVMKDWPDNCVDLVLTDPPYGVAYKKQGETYMVGDTVNMSLMPLPLFRNLLKDNGAIYMFAASTRFLDILPTFQTYFKLHNIIIWDKKHGQPKPPQLYNFRYEPILYGSKGLHRLNNCWDDIVQEGTVRGANRQHPTQKPLKPIAYLIINSTKEGDLILDPFCGSGTTCVAAKMLGRRYIGIDISEKYCEIARMRLKAVDTGVPVKEQLQGQAGLFEK